MRQNRRLFSTFAYAQLPLLLAAVATLAGCGDGKIARYPVSGQVLVDGAPAQGAMVIFCPTEGSPEVMRERPFSRTDAEGNFELRTFEPGDGAPAGQYKIMVRWPGASANQDRAADQRDGGGAALGDRLRGKYTNPEQSGLTFTVVEGTNEVPPFQLTAK